jgi:polysaccharide export outer membrane protein
MRWSLLRWPLLYLTIAVSVGCASTATTQYASVPVDVRLSNLSTALGAGDEIDIRVHEEPTLSGIWVVSPVGQIDFPLLGSLTVEGLSTNQLAALIRSRLGEKFLRNPFVAVQAKSLQSKRVLVLGEVKTPGRLVYTDRLSVVDAVTLAGGFTTLAERNYTIVTRTDGKGTQRIAVPVEKIMQGLAANFLLQPGDIVFVPETVL